MSYYYSDLKDYEDLVEDNRQLASFRSNPPHFLTVSAKENHNNA